METTLNTLPEVVNVEEAARYLRVSKKLVYEAIARQELRAVKLGKRLLIPRAALAKLMEVAA